MNSNQTNSGITAAYRREVDRLHSSVGVWDSITASCRGDDGDDGDNDIHEQMMLVK